MGSLDGPIWSNCSIALIYLSSAHQTGKDGFRARMNVAAHQEKEKNEETKTGKKKAEEDRRQATDF